MVPLPLLFFNTTRGYSVAQGCYIAPHAGSFSTKFFNPFESVYLQMLCSKLNLHFNQHIFMLTVNNLSTLHTFELKNKAADSDQLIDG